MSRLRKAQSHDLHVRFWLIEAKVAKLESMQLDLILAGTCFVGEKATKWQDNGEIDGILWRNYQVGALERVLSGW